MIKELIIWLPRYHTLPPIPVIHSRSGEINET